MKLSPVRRQYLAILNDLEWHSACDVAALVGKAASSVSQVYSNLARQKLAVFQAPDHYAITEAGRAALSEPSP